MKALCTWRLGILAIGLMLVGCGQASSDGSTITRSKVDSSKIDFWSPAVDADGVISSEYSCGGGTFWFPLKWGSVPGDTKELIVFIGRYKNDTVDSPEGLTVTFGGQVAHIGPKIHGIEANTFPSPEVIPAYFEGSHSCAIQNGETYLLKLFALDHLREVPSASLSAGFVTGLAEEALGVGGFAGDSAAETKLTKEALAVGQFEAHP